MGVIVQYKFRNGKFSINNIFYESEGLLKYSKSKKAWILTLSMKDADFDTTWTVNGLRDPEGNVEFTFAAKLNGQVFGGSKYGEALQQKRQKATSEITLQSKQPHAPSSERIENPCSVGT